ncbi:MAG TPA: hypothetical protein VKX35_07190 [Fermentimonas sp.]|nr:hypothetical protein [Fermentimonas sp.]
MYHVLKDDLPYNELGADYLNDRMEKRRQRYLKTELEKMGYRVQLLPTNPVQPTGA